MSIEFLCVTMKEGIKRIKYYYRYNIIMPFNRQLEDELIESSAKPLDRQDLLQALAIAQKQLDRIERYVNDDIEWYSANEQEMLTLQSKRKNIKYFINFESE